MNLMASVKEWLNNKSDQDQTELVVSRTYPIERLRKITIDLSVVQDLNNPKAFDLSFRSFLVGRVYQTSVPSVSKSGNIFMFFDQKDIGNINNAIFIAEGFDLDMKFMCHNAFFVNPVTQADTSMDIYFFADAVGSTGVNRTQITNTVSVAQTKYPIPTSIITRTASGTGATATYTVPVGFYARINAATLCTGLGGPVVNINTITYCVSNGTAGSVSSNNANGATVPAGTIIDCIAGAGVNTSTWAIIELYAA